MLLAFVFIFLLPLALHGAWWMSQEHADSWRNADWSSAEILPPIDDSSAASIVIFSAPTGRWKGIFSVHTWIALKEAGPSRFVRYDVVGWGQPVHVNEHEPDGKWYGNIPKVVARFDGREAEKLLPAFRSAITSYSYRQAGDYRLWPGPNSNTFITSLLVAVPQANVVMPSNAIGRDWRGSFYVGPSPSRTGAQVSLFGVLGVTLGWTDGIELNVLGLVVGLDVRRFAVKLPGWGAIGLSTFDR